VQRAKRLLDETALPMTEIAMRAGFGSLRRFNSIFAEIYGRPPTEIRRKRRAAGNEEQTAEDVANENSLTFLVPFAASTASRRRPDATVS
jgi:hypothetical protein